MTLTVEEICGRIAATRRAGTQPVVVAFANSAYAALTENWLWHVGRIGIDNVTICALDDETFTLVQRLGANTVRVAEMAVLSDLWILRAQTFEGLARGGVDFIHSDVDALWIRDPRPRLMQTGAQLAFSQGTKWPRDIVEDWGFVVCCGLFLARATPKVAEFFRQVSLRIVEEKDDQISVNRALRDAGVKWDVGGADQSRREWTGISFSTYDAPVLGHVGDLSVALMPHDEFPRLLDSIGPRVSVAHPLSPKDSKAKINQLVELGLWRAPR